MEGKTKNAVLIVDDEKINLMILSKILGSEYTIYTATNGANAIEKAQEFSPDLILLDIVMPDMDGYQTLSGIKNCETIRDIPVIIISGLGSDEDEEKGLALDAADYISKPFSEKIVLLRVRNQIQIVNHLRTIERLSMLDQLTQIPNRRSFDERIDMEWKKAIREKTPISILILDVDKFKTFNDTYGHQQGDVVLQTVAKIPAQSLKRPSDFNARWGGEEFVVLLPNTMLDGAMAIAEKIRGDIEKADIPHDNGSPLKVTVSIGVNSLVPQPGAFVATFISSADNALYAAKDAGRNRVMASVNE